MHFMCFQAVFAFMSDSLTTIEVELHQCPSHQSILLSQGPIHERAVFQTFWKPDCSPNSLFFELETSNFGYLPISIFCLKGLSFKPSGNLIVAPYLCFFNQRLQILVPCLFFDFAELWKVSARLDNIDVRHSIRVSPLNFWQIKNSKNININVV